MLMVGLCHVNDFFIIIKYLMKVMPSTITTNILPKKKKKKKKEKERGFLDVACTYSGSRISCKKVSILQFVSCNGFFFFFFFFFFF